MIKTLLLAAVKVTLTVGLFALALRSIDIGDVLLHIRRLPLSLLASTAGLLLCQMLVCGVRLSAIAGIVAASSNAVEIDGRLVPVALDSVAIKTLSRGQPALVRLGASDGDESVDGNYSEIILKPDFPLPTGQFIAPLDAEGRADLLASSEVTVAGVGRKKVVIDPLQVDQLLRSGEAVLRFSENPESSLMIRMLDGSGSGQSPQFARMRSFDASVDVSDQIETNIALLSSVAMNWNAATDYNGASASPYDGNAMQVRQPPSNASYASIPPPDPNQISLPRFPLVFFVPYLQDWTLSGYARGALLNTISLGPLEETTIEVFSWERRRRETEDTTGREDETTREGTVNNKDTLQLSPLLPTTPPYLPTELP